MVHPVGNATDLSPSDISHAIIGLGTNLELADFNSVADVGLLEAADIALDTRIDQLELDDTVVVLTPGASVAYNAALGHVATLLMAATIAETITITNLAAGESCTIISTQNATAGTLIFDSVFFAGGTEPTVSSGSGAVDVYTIVMVGTQLYGFVAGQDLKT